jgi:RNA polymerase sigma factor (sigma-70 family)
MSVGENQEHVDFQGLLQRAQSGSEEAARELYETYVKHVLRSVRHRMWKRMRTRFDSEDFTQQVWCSFFTGGAAPQFKSPQELIAFLQTMAERKVILENRRLTALKQNVRRESPIDEQDDQVGYHPAAADPTPSALAVGHELYDRAIARQDPEVREVADLRIQGNTFHEIAESLEIDERTARRLMGRVKRHAQPDSDWMET